MPRVSKPGRMPTGAVSDARRRPRLEPAVPLTLRLVLIALFAYAGFQRAGWFGRRYGRTPWGLPPVVWGVFTGFSLFLGCLLLAIAERQGRAAAAQRPTAPAGYPGAPFGAPPGDPSPFGAPPGGPPPFGAPPFGTTPSPQFGPAPSGQFGPGPEQGEPPRRRPALNDWQDDPSGGFFGTTG